MVKVEEGMCSGRVLYHSFIRRSAAESEAQQKEIDERERLRSERRRQQVVVCFSLLITSRVISMNTISSMVSTGWLTGKVLQRRLYLWRS